MTERTCTIEGCERPLLARGMCNLHYKRANAERRGPRRREIYAANAEAEHERSKAWRDANPESAHASVKAWEQANPWRVRSLNSMKDARRRAPNAHVEYVDLEAVLTEHGMTCHICGDPLDPDVEFHFDHVQPLAQGGDHIRANLLPAHSVCNIRKKGSILDAPSNNVGSVATG